MVESKVLVAGMISGFLRQKMFQTEDQIHTQSHAKEKLDSVTFKKQIICVTLFSFYIER